MKYSMLTTGSPKKHETLKATWGLLMYILISMIEPSIKTNMRMVSVMLTEFYLNLREAFSLFTRANILSQEIGMSHVFWDSLYVHSFT